jgi:hypothetical protein
MPHAALQVKAASLQGDIFSYLSSRSFAPTSVRVAQFRHFFRIVAEIVLGRGTTTEREALLLSRDLLRKWWGESGLLERVVGEDGALQRRPLAVQPLSLNLPDLTWA